FLSAVIAASAACSGSEPETSAASSAGAGGAGFTAPNWLPDAHVLVHGLHAGSDNRRADICRNNDNTELVNWPGAIWLVHRTAHSQVLGDNSALHVYKSVDGGATFKQTALIPALTGRDIRDPHFYIVGETLAIKTLCRLPVLSARDSDVDTI